VPTQITIAEAAERSGLSAHTLRYYERIGLIHPVGRGQNGHRRYGRGDIEWLEFLIKLRTTDMPIRQMVEYAELVREGPQTASRRRAMLETHRDALRERIAELEETAGVIDHKIETYTEMESST
jgi:DNA-binding transcriptional MerR regulator